MTGLYVVSNPQAWGAQTQLQRNINTLGNVLTRLGTGLRLNTGKDDPAGIIGDTLLKSDIRATTTAIQNTQRANSVIAVAQSALGQISSLLNDIRTLVNASANSGAMTPDQVGANQLQVDASIDSIDRIANTTNFQGKKLLDGSMSFTTEVLGRAEDQPDPLVGLDVTSANFGTQTAIDVEMQVLALGEKAELFFESRGLSEAAIVEIGGNKGRQMLSFAAGASFEDIASQVNLYTDSTCVRAVAGKQATKGQLLITSAGANNDINLVAKGAGFDAGNYAVKFTVSASNEPKSVITPPYGLQPGIVEIQLPPAWKKATASIDEADIGIITTQFKLDSRAASINYSSVSISNTEGIRVNAINYIPATGTNPRVNAANRVAVDLDRNGVLQVEYEASATAQDLVDAINGIKGVTASIVNNARGGAVINQYNTSGKLVDATADGTVTTRGKLTTGFQTGTDVRTDIGITITAVESGADLNGTDFVYVAKGINTHAAFGDVIIGGVDNGVRSATQFQPNQYGGKVGKSVIFTAVQRGSAGDGYEIRFQKDGSSTLRVNFDAGNGILTFYGNGEYSVEQINAVIQAYDATKLPIDQINNFLVASGDGTVNFHYFENASITTGASNVGLVSQPGAITKIQQGIASQAASTFVVGSGGANAFDFTLTATEKKAQTSNITIQFKNEVVVTNQSTIDTAEQTNAANTQYNDDNLLNPGDPGFRDPVVVPSREYNSSWHSATWDNGTLVLFGTNQNTVSGTVIKNMIESASGTPPFSFDIKDLDGSDTFDFPVLNGQSFSFGTLGNQQTTANMVNKPIVGIDHVKAVTQVNDRYMSGVLQFQVDTADVDGSDYSVRFVKGGSGGVSVTMSGDQLVITGLGEISGADIFNAVNATGSPAKNIISAIGSTGGIFDFEYFDGTLFQFNATNFTQRPYVRSIGSATGTQAVIDISDKGTDLQAASISISDETNGKNSNILTLTSYEKGRSGNDLKVVFQYDDVQDDLTAKWDPETKTVTVTTKNAVVAKAALDAVLHGVVDEYGRSIFEASTTGLTVGASFDFSTFTGDGKNVYLGSVNGTVEDKLDQSDRNTATTIAGTLGTNQGDAYITTLGGVFIELYDSPAQLLARSEYIESAQQASVTLYEGDGSANENYVTFKTRDAGSEFNGLAIRIENSDGSDHNTEKYRNAVFASFNAESKELHIIGDLANVSYMQMIEAVRQATGGLIEMFVAKNIDGSGTDIPLGTMKVGTTLVDSGWGVDSFSTGTYHIGTKNGVDNIAIILKDKEVAGTVGTDHAAIFTYVLCDKVGDFSTNSDYASRSLNRDTGTIVKATLNPDNDGSGKVFYKSDIDPLQYHSSALQGGRDGGTSSMTVDEVIDFINSDPELSRLFYAERAAGNDGTGLVSFFQEAAYYGSVDDQTALQFLGPKASAEIVFTIDKSEIGRNLANQHVSLSWEDEATDCDGNVTPARMVVHLATDQYGNATTTARELVDYFNSLSLEETHGVSVSLLRPRGIDNVADVDCTDDYGKGVLKKTATADDCGQTVTLPIVFMEIRRTTGCDEVKGGVMMQNNFDDDPYGVKLESVETGSRQSVSMHLVSGTLNVVNKNGVITDTAGGADAMVLSNGTKMTADGNRVASSTSMLAFSATLGIDVQAGDVIRFRITDGGSTFQLGADVTTQQQIRISLPNVGSASLGGSSGRLVMLRSDGVANLSTDTKLTDRIVQEAISEISFLRGRLGTTQRSTLQPNEAVLEDTVEQLSSAESLISNADFAEESSRMTRSQILVQSSSQVLTLVNQTPQYAAQLIRS